MILFFIVGLIFATLGLFMYLDAYFFRKKARTVPGKVVGYETSRSKNGRYFHPVVQYRDQGSTYRFKADIGSSSMGHSIDEDVEVLILDDQHSSARLKRMARPILALAFLFMGLLPMGIFVFELKSVTHQIYAFDIGLLLIVGGTYALLRFSKVSRERKQREYNYQKDGKGVIGYETTREIITDADDVQKATVSKRVHVFGAVVGAALIAGALYWSVSLQMYMDKAIRTHGVIISQNSSYSDGSTTYAPILRHQLNISISMRVILRCRI